MSVALLKFAKRNKLPENRVLSKSLKRMSASLKLAFINIPLVNDKCDRSSPEKSVFGSIRPELPLVLIIVMPHGRIERMCVWTTVPTTLLVEPEIRLS